MDRDFIQARIDKTKVLIVAYEDAVEALVNGGVQQYSLDTGQSRQMVNKFDVSRLNKEIDRLYNRCATLEARLNGGSLTGVPAW